MTDLASIKARVRMSQAKTTARALIGMKFTPEALLAACELVGERFTDIDVNALRAEMQGEHDRAMQAARSSLLSAHISARAEQAYHDLTGQTL